MTQRSRFQTVRGIRDILPPDSALWNRVEQTAREVFATYTFQEIRLPIFERTELFARSIGLDTDIVSKEMYSWEDHEHPELEALRSQILLRQPNINQPPAIQLLHSQISDFLVIADQGLARGTIPSVPLNLRIMADLKTMLDHIVGEHAPQGLLSDLMPSMKDMLTKFVIGDRLTLRPEATASVVRAYIEHGMQTLPSPVRLYYMGPMFRRERPQKGRYRQFYQIGAELLGPNIAHFSVDADVITMLVTLLEKCDLTEFSLSINSVGCKECRTLYVELLRSELRKVKDNLATDSQKRIETNPLRVFDSKIPHEQQIIESLPTITNYLCLPCKEHYEGLKTVLKSREIKFTENPRLVRGLDYYVRTTFEVTASGLGSQDAICGGGRYDGLVEELGGPKFRQIAGIGFAIGEDRLIQTLQYSRVSESTSPDVLIAWRDDASREHAEIIARLLRDTGMSVEVPVKRMSPRDGLGLANSLGVPIGVVVGPDEASAGVFSVRLLAEDDQASLSKDQVVHLQLLLKFRVLLERELQRLAVANDIDHRNVSIVALADRLIKANLIDASYKTLIEMAAHTFNATFHGQEVTAHQMSEAIAASVRILDGLVSSSSKTRFLTR